MKKTTSTSSSYSVVRKVRVMENEIFEWSLIENYPDYEVSDVGEVRNRRTGRKLAGFIDKDGYRIVHLYSNGCGCNQKVHRLVAKAFLEYDPKRDQVNHKNGDKADNRIFQIAGRACHLSHFGSDNITGTVGGSDEKLGSKYEPKQKNKHPFTSHF